MDPEIVLEILNSEVPVRSKLRELEEYAYQEAETVEMSVDDDSFETEPEEGSAEKPIDLTK